MVQGECATSRMSRCHKLKVDNQRAKILRLAPALLAWFEKNARDLPWRRTTDPYAIWVSEIMLQQTQVKTVLGYWERWMRALPTVKALAGAKLVTIHKLWEGLGYYTRVRNMQKAAKEIVAKHRARFPDDYETILELPGIGRYTAGAIASIAFNQPRPILDGNVMRVLARIFGISGNAREAGQRKTLEPGGRFGHRSFPAITLWRERMLASKPVANGTGRAGLHTQATEVRSVSGAEILPGVADEPRGRVAELGQAESLDAEEVYGIRRRTGR